MIPTITAPKVNVNINEDQWNSFTHSWNDYKTTVSITAPKIPIFLLSCCSPDLKAIVERADPLIINKTCFNTPLFDKGLDNYQQLVLNCIAPFFNDSCFLLGRPAHIYMFLISVSLLLLDTYWFPPKFPFLVVFGQ